MDFNLFFILFLWMSTFLGTMVVKRVTGQLGRLDEACTVDVNCNQGHLLTCQANQCKCLTGYTAPNAIGQRCVGPPVNNEGCLLSATNPLYRNCNPGFDLSCEYITDPGGVRRQVCTCTTLDHSPFPIGRCLPSPTFGHDCETQNRLPSCNRNLGYNLACAGGKCECRNGFARDPSNNGRCRTPAFGDACDPALCNRAQGYNLQCDNNICACQLGLQNYGTDGKCALPVNFDGDCTQAPCNDEVGYNLECRNGRCACANGFYESAAQIERCVPPSALGDPCPRPICNTLFHIQCNTNLGVCECLPGYSQFPGSTDRCVRSATFNEKCDPPPCNTEPGYNLQCDNNRCACVQGMQDYIDGKCAVPANFDGDCTQAPCNDEVGYNLDLQCQNGRCACASGFYESAAQPGRCDPPSAFGGPCPRPICNNLFFLQCNTNLSQCECQPGHIVDPRNADRCVPAGVIGPAATFGGPCPPDCNVGYFLKCENTICVCLDNYELDHNPRQRDRCTRIPSLYGETCQMHTHCAAFHHMHCDATTNPQRPVCACKDGFELDGGTTPCKEIRFGGRLYNEACDAKYDCSPLFNLTCIQGTCRCIQNPVHVLARTGDPNHGQQHCITGGGYRTLGQTCVQNSNLIYEKCNDLLHLTCSAEGVCICGQGYVTFETGTGIISCESGNQTYGEICDPPEVILPPRPIDPNTGLPFPGPTNSPKPKFACDPNLNLDCYKGKCQCMDEHVSKKWRPDEYTKGCLINAGYACTKNDECLTRKCKVHEKPSNKSNPHSHTHSTLECCCVVVCEDYQHIDASTRPTPQIKFYILIQIIVQLINAIL